MNSRQTPATRGRTVCQALVIGLCLLFALPGTASPLVIRFAHVVAQETPKGLAVVRFQELVAQRSGGRMRVEVYPDAELYGDRDEFEALHAGAVEMLAPSLSKFGRVGFPEFEIFDLPFLFADMQQVHRITGGPLGKKLLQGLHRQGIVGLGYLDNGFKQMSAHHALLAPQDFVGLRMRVQSSRVIAAQMRALGAYPVSLPFSATREALAKGIVQGTENPVSNFWTQRMQTVQSDLSLTRHGYLGYAVITSERFWRSLSEADRQLLIQALQEALEYGNRIADAQNAKDLSALRMSRTTTVHEMSLEQRTQLRTAVQPAYEELGQRIGARWLKDVAQALGH